MAVRELFGAALWVIAVCAIGGCPPKPVTSEEQPPPVVPAAPPREREDGVTAGQPLWWLDEPQRQGGRFRACADAVAESLSEARRIAVERGLAVLDRSFPDGRPEYRLTTWAGAANGGFRVAVLVEAGDSIEVDGGVRAGAVPAKDGP